ncbi:hypothetical protein Trydic_g1555 [Trypoxylus dichotomus]
MEEQHLSKPSPKMSLYKFDEEDHSLINRCGVFLVIYPKSISYFNPMLNTDDNVGIGVRQGDIDGVLSGARLYLMTNLNSVWKFMTTIS